MLRFDKQHSISNKLASTPRDYKYIMKTIINTSYSTTSLMLRLLVLPSIILPSVSFAATIDLDSQPYVIMGTPAVSSANLKTSPGVMYEARFNNNNYTGDLIVREIATSGAVAKDEFDANGLISVDNSIWRASRLMRAINPSDRKIVTSDIDGTANRFRWSALSDESKLIIDPTATLDDPDKGIVGDATNLIVDWLRGDATNEGDGSGNFRDRTSKWIGTETFHNKIGSIVSSSPAYVGTPIAFYTDNNYDAFQASYRTRTPMVYVGANDGMLHAFDASTGGLTSGSEVFAYVPHSVLGTLKEHVKNDNVEQVYSADGSPVVADAHGNFPSCPTSAACWRTILVSGLNGGGRGVFALDITDPATTVTTESSAKNLLLWEAKHTDNNIGEDLGFTFSRPIIAKLSDGTWVSIFGNGYNNTGSGEAILYVVKLDDGTVIKKITTSRLAANSAEKPNGLSSVRGWDNNGDGLINYVYAGDLDGNLWKFDLSTADAAGNNFTIAYSQKPLIQVVNSSKDTAGNTVFLPITSAPEVTQHPGGGLIVYFGNGIALDATHELVVGDRSVFGIFDDKPTTDTENPPYGEYPNNNFQLTTHTIGTDADGVLRGIKSTTASTDNVGWELKLGAAEQALSNLVVSNKRLNFISVESSLAVNNFNWLSSVDFVTGGAPASPVFDSNLDGDINSDDIISLIGGSTDIVPIGGALGKGVSSAPRLVTVDSGKDVMLITLTVEIVNEFNSPFNDPGLVGGHFDQDESYLPNSNIDWQNVQNHYGESLFNKHTHEHEYDDKYDVNGVNLLVKGDPKPIFGDEPNVESSTGIADKYTSLKGGVSDVKPKAKKPKDKTKLEDKNGTQILPTDSVEISIINPHSVDTQTWANERFDKGISSDKLALPATFYFVCDSLPVDQQYPSGIKDGAGNYTGGISAPVFAALPAAERRCKIDDISELRVRYNDINAMRASTPSCVKDKNLEGPLLPPTSLLQAGQLQNSQYRDGAFVVRASLLNVPGQNNTFKEPIEPIWENYTYEHLKELNDLPDRRSVKCGLVNEDLRKFRPIVSDIAADVCAGKKGKKLEKCLATLDPDGETGEPTGTPNEEQVDVVGQGGFAGFVGSEEYVISIKKDPFSGETVPTSPFSTDIPNTRRINWKEILSK